MMTKIRATITVDPGLMQKAREALKGSGISVSNYLNIALLGLVDAETKPVKELMNNMVVELMSGASGATNTPKKDRRRKVASSS